LRKIDTAQTSSDEAKVKIEIVRATKLLLDKRKKRGIAARSEGYEK
jgi:hypothetical protein